MDIIIIVTLIGTLIGIVAGLLEILKYINEKKELRSRDTKKFIRVIIPSTNPQPPQNFIGRITEIKKIRALLESKSNNCAIAIIGMGGIGKSTLARRICKDLEADYQIIWTNLGESPDFARILDNWAQLVGINVSEFADPHLKAGVVRQAINRVSGNLLIVLDDVWEAEDIRFLRDYALPQNIKVLITTESLELARVLDFDPVELRVFSSDDVTLYFRKIFSMIEGKEKQIEAAGKLVGNLPLAIELITHMIDDISEIDEAVEKIQEENTLNPSDLERASYINSQIENCFSISYRHLPANEQRCFRITGAFANVCFSQKAINEIAGEDMGDEVRILLRRALLSRYDDDSLDLIQHTLLNKYAHKLLIKEGEEQAVSLAHAYYYLELDNTNHWKQWDIYFDQINRGWEILLHWNDVKIQDYFDKITAYLIVHSRWIEIINYGLQALENSQKNNRIKEQASLNGLIGYYYWQLGNNAKAHTYLTAGLEISRANSYYFVESSCLNTMGLVKRVIRQFEESLSYFQKSLKIRKRIGYQVGVAYNLHNIGVTYYHLRNFKKAETYLRESINLFNQILEDNNFLLDTDRSEAQVGKLLSISSYARVLLPLGRKEEVLKICSEGLFFAQETGDNAAICRLQGVIGKVYREENRTIEALHAFNESLLAAEKIGHLRGQVRAWIWSGQALFNVGKFSEALDYLSNGLQIQELLSDPIALSANHRMIARALRKIGNIKDAKAQFNIAILLSNESKDLVGESIGYWELSKMDNDDHSERNRVNAIALLEQSGYKSFEEALSFEYETFPI